MSLRCEACELNDVQVVETCDDAEEPYRVCSDCHHRLLARSLRPLEWYNLAKRHDWNQFLLHDDFYDEDGTACQPEEDVEDAERFPAPSLVQVCGDPSSLLDYSITRWRFSSELKTAWATFSHSSILAVLSARFASTRSVSIRSTILEICAAGLGDTGAEFVRYAWGEYPAGTALWSLAQASAACLPFREGFDRVTASLADFHGRDKIDRMSALGHFHSTEALDWIEVNIAEPLTESWGYLAAASAIDWPRVVEWLNHGRPLSLVGIDALLAITDPRSPFLRDYNPRLVNRPTLTELRETLITHRNRDSVPRVAHRIGAILSNTGKVSLPD